MLWITMYIQKNKLNLKNDNKAYIIITYKEKKSNEMLSHNNKN